MLEIEGGVGGMQCPIKPLKITPPQMHKYAKDPVSKVERNLM